ncbi:BrnA antitoxin family protein [Jannaschia sp. W003]|uniref:BrnA antitoxin family protein n=1 Tax=Jannaschia sp. W003 TaxID=2867012 RepID=UPI0021A53460|nr:BrnA antitoxin family protein [Jannaschia sp. W003]UWQ21193.1 BrnA antitoxin family protein [Jannaschia sp. W003]
MATTKRERNHLNEMLEILWRFEWDMHSKITREERFPKEWTEIWRRRSARKRRVTIRVDEDVLRFFRSMGDGYGPRMNGVLRSFMLCRLGGLIENEDLLERYREDWMDKPRPRDGKEIEEMYGKIRRTYKAGSGEVPEEWKFE